jgi:predicted transcriptional regulator
MEDKIMKNMKLDTWIKVINLNENGNIRGENIRTQITYNHIFLIYKHLQECGIIFMEKVGRENKIKLTEKGKQLQGLFKQIDELLGGISGSAKTIEEVGH